MQAYEEARKRLSDNLRKARGRVGLSQEALALQAGINRSYVGQIERGIGNPSLQVLVKLAVWGNNAGTPRKFSTLIRLSNNRTFPFRPLRSEGWPSRLFALALRAADGLSLSPFTLKDTVMNRRLLLVALAIGSAMASLVAWRLTATPAQPPAPPAVGTV